MNDLLLSCAGARIGSIWLPPLKVHAGQFYCLHVPGPVHISKEETEIAEALAGRHRVEGLQVFGRAEWAKQPTGPTGLLRFLAGSPSAHWLSRAARIPINEARTRVERLGFPSSERLGRLSGNPLTLLGLEAAWARGAQIVVFTTCGWCDPRGMQHINELISRQHEGCAALHLSHVDIHGEWHCTEFYPAATHLVLEREPGPQPISNPASGGA